MIKLLGYFQPSYPSRTSVFAHFRKNKTSAVFRISAVRIAGAAPEFAVDAASLLHYVPAFGARLKSFGGLRRAGHLFHEAVVNLLIDVAVGKRAVGAVVGDAVVVSQSFQ